MLLFLTTVYLVTEGCSRSKIQTAQGGLLSTASQVFLSPRWPVRETVDTMSEVPFQRCPSLNTHLLYPIHFPKRHRCKTDPGMAAELPVPAAHNPT